MPSKTAQRPNFLLKITLVKTTNPTVTRLISVPFDLTFTDLHRAIAAAFGWDDACIAWLFRIWSADPVQYCDQLKHKGGVAIYYTAPDIGLELKPMSLRADSKIGQHLKKEGSGKFWTYDFDISRFHHAIEVVDTLNDDQKGTIGCLGGQGQVSRKAWQYADLGGLEGVTVGAKSTWDLDMKTLNQRLKVVHDAYEQRKENEVTKAAAKTKVPPRGNVTMPAQAKGKSKPKGLSQAKPPKKTPLKKTGQPGPMPADAQDKVPTTQTTPATEVAAAGIIPPISGTLAIPTPTQPTSPIPTPLKGSSPTGTVPTKSAPSKAAKTIATAKPTLPGTTPVGPSIVATPETAVDTGTPSTAALSRKRPLATENQRKAEQVKKKARVVKTESVVKNEEEEEGQDIIRLGGESP